jgi:hypothetical protein
MLWLSYVLPVVTSAQDMRQADGQEQKHWLAMSSNKESAFPNNSSFSLPKKNRTSTVNICLIPLAAAK